MPPAPEPSPATAVDPHHTIDPTAVELVLRRAIELAAATGPQAEPERVPVALLHQVAEELAVPAAAVNGALAEYQAAAGGPLPATLTGRRGPLDRLVGPATVAAVRHTDLPADVALDHLQRWLIRRHHLRTQVTTDHTVVAHQRRGLVPAVSRSIRNVNGSAGLSGVREVRASAVDAGPGASSLCLMADVRHHRTQAMVAGTATTAGTAAAIGVVAVLTGPVVVVGLPAAVGGGWLVTRLTHRRRVAQIRAEVELTATRAAAGATPPTLVSEMIGRLDHQLGRRLAGPATRR